MAQKPKLTTGELGWIGLLAYVVLVDSIAWVRQANGKRDETMSVSFGRALQYPGPRSATIVAWGVVTAHLFWSAPLPGSTTLKKLVLDNFTKNT